MISDFSSGVFAGPNALEHFLKPQNHPPTPLVELPHSFLGQLATENVHVLAKCEYLGPLLNVKMRQVAALVEDAATWNELLGVNTLVEGSSGSTAHILPIYAKAAGIEKVEILVSPGLAQGKMGMINLTGAHIQVSETGIEDARLAGKQAGWRNLGQYTSPANPCGMEALARQIYAQTQEGLSVFCAGMGTRATIVGAARYLQAIGSLAKFVGVLLAAHHKVPGVRTLANLQKAFGCEDIIIPVTMERDPSFLASIRLIRSGILGGPSSGFALMGLLKFLNAHLDAGTLDTLRNKNGEVVAVFICADPPHLYIDEYAPYLEMLKKGS